MCGIVAMFSNEQPVSPDALARATAALHHRGPDGQRQWIAPHGRVGLGHARLSIIDLTTGDQPIANEDETLHVVVNGEFYDYQRYQRALTDRGHRLRTRSDSEILLHLYEEEGTHCLRHLRGEFAFVLWDERNGLLFAARDRFGIKPLYYARRGDTLYFASEAKALFAAGVPARWDHESVYQQVHGVMDGDRSLFAGVNQVPPGHYLLASRHHTQVLRYWDLNYPTLDAPSPVRSEAEHIERMREELREAIRLRLRADVPVGCYVSGGLDSCAILGIAADLRDDPIEAFTIAFEEGPFDEGPIAEEMARHVGARFHRFHMPEEMLAQHYPDAVAHCEMIAGNANCVAKYLLSRHVRDFGFKVVMTGEGSDEILAGYPFFRRDMLQHDAGTDTVTTALRLVALGEANKIYGGFAGTAGLTLPLDGVAQTLGFVPSILANFGERGHRIRPVLSADFRAEFADRDPYRVLLNRLDVTGQMQGRAAVHQAMYLWTKTMLPNILLNYLGDRMEMAHSIEGRTPFLDHHLVEAVVAMPADMKVHATTEKYVLREAAQPYLTQTVYRRQKHPFMAPIELEGGLQELVQDTLRGRTLASAPFFNQRAVVEVLDSLPGIEDRETRDRVFPMLLALTSSCILQERYRL
ncbi:MAG: asparagine synthase (glutamine-hydrolyzing) [Deltaproteobacteria bacterium]|nr:asparagine synthase (glutamine-hydrolyzing) [Deltaproteobacteria bacterium]